MRYTFVTILAFAIAAVGVYSLVRADVFSPRCNTPISYRIGDIDEQFTIGSSTVRDLLADASDVWEQNSDKNLFEYKPDDSADLTVDFVYDQRQQRTRAKDKITDNLDSLANSHGQLTDGLDDKRDRYEALRSDYRSARRQYEAKLNEYNQRVDRWNNRRRIPDSVRSDLKQQRRRLDEIRTSLETTRQRLQDLQAEINRLAERSNDIAETYNARADTFADRFGSGREFNQATYKDDAITVYQFNQTTDLRLALAHEFGHALGIKHVDDPQAVMHPLMKEQSMADINLQPDDRQALMKVCN
jgi:archaellum component FlaC